MRPFNWVQFQGYVISKNPHHCTLFQLTVAPIGVHIPIEPLQLGSRDQIFPYKIFIMGYTLKTARRGKSISKISKLRSLRPLALKSKFIWQFEISKI